MKNEIVINEEVIVEDSYVLEFTTPYLFEGKDYKKIDLSNLENITAEHMIRAEKATSRSGEINLLPEVTTDYACYIAAEITKMPIEFFKRMGARETIKLRNIVMGFFYS